MLIEIRSDVFSQKQIEFHDGLNVVLGDASATNSIGKSTLLMLVDFAFGGNSFVENDGGAIQNLGHHHYYFSHLFHDEKHIFKRSTYKPDLLYQCSEDYSELQAIDISEFRSFLKLHYDLGCIDLSFRSSVSLYSRIWGKENLNVKKALNSHPSQNASDCIENILKIFEKYEPIKKLSIDLKAKNEERKIINGAYKNNLIPKITKTQYKRNLKEIRTIQDEIEDIKINLAKYALNLSEIASKEILELKEQKDKLLIGKASITSRLARVRNNLAQNRHIKSKHLLALKKYFPDVKEDNLIKVEEFHCDITKILKSELKESEKELTSEINSITDELNKIDERISITLSKIDNPEIIVDRVYQLSNNHKEATAKNDYFDTDKQVKESIKEIKENLVEKKGEILKLVSNIVNDKIRDIVTSIYSKNKKSPDLTLNDKSYNFEIHDNTGTGTAYSNLLLLDLAFLYLTRVPFVIHDSLLYKNIENEAVSNFINVYLSQPKQTFISIDEIEKYGKTTKDSLEKHKVIQLSNTNVLYIKDWRDEKKF